MVHRRRRVRGAAGVGAAGDPAAPAASRDSYAPTSVSATRWQHPGRRAREQQGPDGAVPAASPPGCWPCARRCCCWSRCPTFAWRFLSDRTHLLGPLVPVRRRPGPDRGRRDDRGRPRCCTDRARTVGLALAVVGDARAGAAAGRSRRSGNADFWRTPARTAAVDRVLDQIPTGSRVAASDNLGARIALRTELYLIGDTYRLRRPAAARLGLRRGGVGRLRQPDRARRPCPAWRGFAAAARQRRVRGRRRGRRSHRRPSRANPDASSVPGMDDPSCRACRGVRRVAHLLRLRADPPDEPDPGRPDRRAGQQLGVLERLPRVPAPDATEDDLDTVHDARADRGGDGGERRPVPGRPRVGLGTEDNPTFPRHAPGRRATSSAPASRRPGRCGPARSTTRPTSPAGCTTRCPTGRAASASTTTWPSRSGGCWPTAPKKVAYVDVDVHHGDGVEQIF